MDEMQADNLAELEPVVDAGADDSDNTAHDEVEIALDEDGNPIDAVDDGEEVEYEGKQYKLPKELKEALLRQQDYTRKTQEVAQSRQSFEAERAQHAQALQLHAQTIKGQAVLHSIDQQLQKFANVDWNLLDQQDPAQAQSLYRQYQMLRDQRGEVAGQITQAAHQAMQLEHESRAKQVQQGQEVLAREIKGWSPALAQELKSYGLKHGYSAHELDSVSDPKAVKLLHKAYMYDQMTAKAGKGAAKPVEQAKPATVVKARTAGAATTDPSKMTDKQFAAWRKSQMAAKRR